MRPAGGGEWSGRAIRRPRFPAWQLEWQDRPPPPTAGKALPLSTSSLLLATQLVFTIVFAVITAAALAGLVLPLVEVAMERYGQQSD
jgi:hypothetical protein